MFDSLSDFLQTGVEPIDRAGPLQAAFQEAFPARGKGHELWFVSYAVEPGANGRRGVVATLQFVEFESTADSRTVKNITEQSVWLTAIPYEVEPGLSVIDLDRDL